MYEVNKEYLDDLLKLYTGDFNLAQLNKELELQLRLVASSVNVYADNNFQLLIDDIMSATLNYLEDLELEVGSPASGDGVSQFDKDISVVAYSRGRSGVQTLTKYFSLQKDGTRSEVRDLLADMAYALSKIVYATRFKSYEDEVQALTASVDLEPLRAILREIYTPQRNQLDNILKLIEEVTRVMPLFESDEDFVRKVLNLVTETTQDRTLALMGNTLTYKGDDPLEKAFNLYAFSRTNEGAQEFVKQILANYFTGGSNLTKFSHLIARTVQSMNYISWIQMERAISKTLTDVEKEVSKEILPLFLNSMGRRGEGCGTLTVEKYLTERIHTWGEDHMLAIVDTLADALSHFDLAKGSVSNTDSYLESTFARFAMSRGLETKGRLKSAILNHLGDTKDSRMWLVFYCMRVVESIHYNSWDDVPPYIYEPSRYPQDILSYVYSKR